MDSSSPAETTTQSFGDLALTFGLSIGVISVIAIGVLVSYFCSRKPAAPAGQSHHGVSLSINGQNSVTVEIGLDEATLNTCPKLLYSEAKEKLEKGADDLVATCCCSICLQDYKDSDLLRLLPECGHFFHAQCIDLWLKLHPTCPICRNSPVPEPINVTGTASGAPRRVLYDTWLMNFVSKPSTPKLSFVLPLLLQTNSKPHHTTGQIFNFGVFVGKTAMEVKEHFEILLHDVIEIDSGRIELPSYKDEDGEVLDWIRFYIWR
ncbi:TRANSCRIPTION FACTOR C2H2 FAMILY-RELATED [Salix koriyanagi]|uniref:TRANSCRIPTION FACTOR C2H2 FAMILY-RELATED n=1 Tax=Salix koriyanagi TaxID=2511006 RepID=A0A9Q0WI75_9ROSI|nr:TRANSCRIPTION FACTOR C2H2 FAMILY-RELATED [Salix koriyanagi]